MTDWLTGSLIYWLSDEQTVWLTDWLTEWLTDLLTDWLTEGPTLLPPFVVNPTQRESHSSHDKSRCLGCMYTKIVGTGRDTTKSSDNMTDGEWTKLPPVMEANVRWYFVSFIMSSVPQLLFCLGWKSYTIKPMSFKFNFDLPLACTFQ